MVIFQAFPTFAAFLHAVSRLTAGLRFLLHVPLWFHCHEAQGRVEPAEVRGLMMSPWTLDATKTILGQFFPMGLWMSPAITPDFSWIKTVAGDADGGGYRVFDIRYGIHLGLLIWTCFELCLIFLLCFASRSTNKKQLFFCLHMFYQGWHQQLVAACGFELLDLLEQ